MQEHKEAYLNSRERMNPELEEKLKSNTTELAKNPAFPKTDKDGNPINFLELIAYKRFNDTVAKVKQYTNVDGVSSNIGLAKLQPLMMQSVRNIIAFEKPHKQMLEKLAVDLIIEEMEIPQDAFQFDSKIVPLGGVSNEGILQDTKEPSKSEVNAQFGEEYPIEEMTPSEYFELLKHKRRFINLLIQGSSKKGHYMFELIRKKLNGINPTLTDNYGILMSVNDLTYWVMSDSTIDSMASNSQNMSGREEIDNETTPATIKTESICFPVSVHELIKGVMEVFGTQGLPDDKVSAQMLIDSVDSIKNETMDLRFGVVIWEKFISAFPMETFEEGSKNLQHHLFSKFCALEINEFFKISRYILSNDERGANYLENMLREIKIDLSQNDMSDLFGDYDDDNQDDDEYAGGGELSREELEESAKIYFSDRYNLTIQNLVEDLDRLTKMQSDLNNKIITPRRVIGTGYKNPRKVAEEWIKGRIQMTKYLIENFNEKNKFTEEQINAGFRLAEGGEVTRNTLIKNLKKGLVVTFKEDIGRLKYSYTMFYDKKNNDIILKEETERKFARNVADKNKREENNIISQKYAFELYQEITGDRKGIKDFNEFYDTNEYAGGGEITDADLNYYIYPTKVVKIAYLGKIQMGYFFSLKDAMKEIEYLTMAYPKNEIEKYAIITPNKTFHLGEKQFPIRYAGGGEAGDEKDLRRLILKKFITKVGKGNKDEYVTKYGTLNGDYENLRLSVNFDKITDRQKIDLKEWADKVNESEFLDYSHNAEYWDFDGLLDLSKESIVSLNNILNSGFDKKDYYFSYALLPRGYDYYVEGISYADGGKIYSSDELYILKVSDFNGNLLDSSKKIRARNLSEAKQIAIDDFESDMQKKYGQDLRFKVELAPSLMKKGGDLYAKGGKTYVMTDDTYVNIFLSRGFTEKRSAYGLRFFEHKPTGIFITYDQRGIQTPVIISTNKSGEESIYEGNTIREVKQALDNAGVTIIKEGIDPTYAEGGKANENTKEIDIDFMQKRYFVNYHIDNKKNIEITSVSSAGEDLDYEKFGDSLKKIILEEIISENDDDYAEGGEVDILKLYQKDVFSDKDSELIDEAIENGDIDTTDIKEDFMGYVYDRIDKEYKDEFETEDIWEYTDEQYENGLTHKENYKKLISFLKNDDDYAEGGEVEDWMEEALESLIQETGFDELEITMVSDNGNEFIATDNKLEYRVFKTEDDAEEKAIEGVREDMEESPENFNKDFIIQYIDGREYFENELNLMNGAYAYEIQNESDEKYENRLIAEMVEWGILNEEQAESDNAEELAEQNIDEFIFLLTNDQLEQGNSGLDYFISTFGEEETMKMVIDNNLIDIDEASKDAVQTDGIAHFLSSYDGETLYLNNDFVAYRVN